MKQHKNLRMIMIVIAVAGLFLAACSEKKGESATKEEEDAPAYTEAVEGSEFSRVVLTEQAAQRLDIQTDMVREEQVNGAQRAIVPYSAVIYGLNGETWVYTNPEPLKFIREALTIDYIDGDMIVLIDGPPEGTVVATVGVPELYGIETGVGK